MLPYQDSDRVVVTDEHRTTPPTQLTTPQLQGEQLVKRPPTADVDRTALVESSAGAKRDAIKMALEIISPTSNGKEKSRRDRAYQKSVN